MTELLLRVNGIQAAFGIEFGLDSPRANEGRAGDPYRQANVSYSLVQRQDGQVVRHTLIDCGMGVVPSLLDFEHTHGVHVVHEILLTHPHFDHFAQLDRLSMCLLRSGRAEQPRPRPIYASQECWENGPCRVHRYLAERSDFRPLRPGIVVSLGDLTVTPFAVDHGPKAPGALAFVVQHGGRKVVITGDVGAAAREFQDTGGTTPQGGHVGGIWPPRHARRKLAALPTSQPKLMGSGPRQSCNRRCGRSQGCFGQDRVGCKRYAHRLCNCCAVWAVI